MSKPDLQRTCPIWIALLSAVLYDDGRRLVAVLLGVYALLCALVEGRKPL